VFTGQKCGKLPVFCLLQTAGVVPRHSDANVVVEIEGRLESGKRAGADNWRHVARKGEPFGRMIWRMTFRLPAILVLGSPLGPPFVRQALSAVAVAILTDQPVDLGAGIRLGRC
jgi:hypothetical protein